MANKNFRVIAREAEGRPKQSVVQKNVSGNYFLNDRLLRCARNDTTNHL